MTYLGEPSPGHRRVDVITVVVLLGVGGLVSALSREQQSQVESSVRATVLYPFLALHRASAERSQVGRRASDLLEERDSLVQLVSRYRALAGEALQLRAESGLENLQLGSVTSAEVYPGRPRVGDPDVFVLRSPGLAALEFPVGVFTGRGLVGVARGPHGRGARGEFWSHTDFRVSVMTEDGAVSGIVRASRPQGEQPVLLLEGAPFQADIAENTVIVTTGIAGVYPPGVTVGRIRELADSEPGWMKRYIVEPAVRPEAASIVLVWERPELPELPIEFYLTPEPDTTAVGSSPP